MIEAFAKAYGFYKELDISTFPDNSNSLEKVYEPLVIHLLQEKQYAKAKLLILDEIKLSYKDRSERHKAITLTMLAQIVINHDPTLLPWPKLRFSYLSRAAPHYFWARLFAIQERMKRNNYFFSKSRYR